MDIEAYIEELLLKYDPEELLDVLGITNEDIVQRFRDRVIEYWKENDDGR